MLFSMVSWLILAATVTENGIGVACVFILPAFEVKLPQESAMYDND